MWSISTFWLTKSKYLLLFQPAGDVLTWLKLGRNEALWNNNNNFNYLFTFDRVGFLPWQKLFLPGQWKKPVKTVAKTSKNRQKLAKSKTP